MGMFRIAVIVFLASVISACGGGGAGGSSNFPDVSGRYSFNTSPFNYSCSDGATGTNPALALNFDVFQNVNVITLVNLNSGGIPGITILDSTATTGNVQSDSSFIVTQITTAIIDGISGTVNLFYNMTGRISSNGWSGTYTYTASSASLGSCTFAASFTGTKITVLKPNLVSKQLNENNYPVSIYDQFSIIGSSMAIDE